MWEGLGEQAGLRRPRARGCRAAECDRLKGPPGTGASRL